MKFHSDLINGFPGELALRLAETRDKRRRLEFGNTTARDTEQDQHAFGDEQEVEYNN